MKKPIDCANLCPGPGLGKHSWHCEIPDKGYEGDCPIYLEKSSACTYQRKQYVKGTTFEVYCLQWTGNNRIPEGGACYTDHARAKKHCEHANKYRSWAARLTGHRWTVRTLTIKEGPK